MAYLPLLQPIIVGESDLGKWQKAVAWIQAAVANAGITVPTNPLLTNVVSGDNDLIKWQKLVAWLSLLANNISGGGGGGSAVQAGAPTLTTGISNLAVVFSTAFAAAPSVVCNLVPPGGGQPILVDPTLITTTGFTAQWGFAVPAGYSLVWVATKTTQ